jgi:hypothetical protein
MDTPGLPLKAAPTFPIHWFEPPRSHGSAAGMRLT